MVSKYLALVLALAMGGCFAANSEPVDLDTDQVDDANAQSDALESCKETTVIFEDLDTLEAYEKTDPDLYLLAIQAEVNAGAECTQWDKEGTCTSINPADAASKVGDSISFGRIWCMDRLDPKNPLNGHAWWCCVPHGSGPFAGSVWDCIVGPTVPNPSTPT